MLLPRSCDFHETCKVFYDLEVCVDEKGAMIGLKGWSICRIRFPSGDAGALCIPLFP